MIVQLEPEIQDGSRAFPKTQELFVGVGVTPGLPNPNQVSWYGTNISPNVGAFALVREGDGLEDLVGEFLSITRAENRAAVRVYVLGEYPELETPIAISRRAFLQIELLPLTPTIAYVEQIQ